METSTTTAAAASSGRLSEAEVVPKPLQPFAWRASNGRVRARRRRGEGNRRTPRQAGRTRPDEPTTFPEANGVPHASSGNPNPYTGLIEPDVIEMCRIKVRADRCPAGNAPEREVHAAVLLAKRRGFAEGGGHPAGT